MELFLFKDLLVLFSFSIVILLIGYQLRLPPVVGFILTGVLAGPHGLALVEKVDDVEMLAQVGIVLLLFGIGMEFSIKKLIEIKRLFLFGGSLQVGLTILFSSLIAFFLGYGGKESFFFGILLSMSSTAIVLGALEQKNDTSSPHGRVALAILIFQDMIAIPLILLLPLLAVENSEQKGFNFQLIVELFAGILTLVAVFFSAELIVPRLLLLVARTRNKELFLLSVLTLCFGVAWLTSMVGLSLTIGAFLAGLIISESEYSNEALSHIFPFQALFISFFFVSIGMLLDLHVVLQQPLLILILACAVIVLKILTAALATLLLGLPLRTALLTAFALSQIGEFSFVLAKIGLNYGLSSDHFYQIFLAVSLLTMAISPFLVNSAFFLTAWILKLPFLKKLCSNFSAENSQKINDLNNHILIVGFGVSGKNLASSSKLAHLPYVILEMNPDTVKEQKKAGEPIYFGDATHLAILDHVHIKQAKALAVLINDSAAARVIVKIAREANPSLYIIVRTRYMQERAMMTSLGADEVIPDEFGTSIEIFSRVLKQYHVPNEEIYACVEAIRADGYDLLRNQKHQSTKLSEIKLNLSHVEIESFRLHLNSPLIGKILSESQLRHLYGLTVLLIKRGASILSNPSPNTELMSGDILVVVGEKMPLEQSNELFGSLI